MSDMKFIKKIKAKRQYNEFISSCFLRAATKEEVNNYKNAMCKEIGSLLIVLCFNIGDNTVSVKKDMFEDMRNILNSSEYKYSEDRIFDVAAMNTVGMMSIEMQKKYPDSNEWPLKVKGDSRLIDCTEIRNPTPAAIIYAKSYFINGGQTDLERFLPHLDCPKFSHQFKGKTVFAIPKKDLVFYGDSAIENIKEQIASHIKEFVPEKEYFSNKFYSYDDDNNLIEIGEF